MSRINENIRKLIFEKGLKEESRNKLNGFIIVKQTQGGLGLNGMIN